MGKSMRGPAIAAFVALALVAVVGASASHGASRAQPKPATAKQWKALVAKAKQEGSVTLYSSQDPNTLATFVQKFKDRYGITVTFNRQIDSVLAAQVTAEEGTGNLKADMWVIASRPFVLGGLKNGWAADAVGPDLFNKRYDRAKYAKPGKAFAVGAAVQGIGWNTKLFPQGLKDYPDLLNPALAGGKIDVVQPTSPSFVDFYQMLEDHYGKDYVPKLAAQKPKIYLSTLPQLQALASGELAAASLVGAAAIDLKAQGAPVDFVLPKKGAWNAPWVARDRANKNTLWLKTFSATGQTHSGNVFTAGGNQRKRFQLLFDDLTRQTVEAIEKSPELKALAPAAQ